MRYPLGHPDEWTEARRKVVILASLMPPPISLDLLTTVTAFSPIKVLKILEELANQGVLRSYEPAGLGNYCFSDPTMSKTILRDLDKAAVRDLAQLLIQHVSGLNLPPDVISLFIANVYFMSELESKALEHILCAANYCFRHDANEAAAVYYRMALDTCEQCVQSTKIEESLIDSAVGLISAQGHCMPLSEQRETLLRAQVCARKLSDRIRLCKIDLLLGEIAKSAGDYPAAGDLFEEAWNFATLLNDDEMRKKAALVSADFLFWQGKVAEAVARYEDAIGDLEQFPSDEATLRACTTLGWCYAICGQPARGLGLIEAARQKATSLGFRQAEMDAGVRKTLTLLDSGYIAEMEVVLQDVFKNSEEDLGNYRLWACYAAHAFALYTKGDLEGCFKFQKKAYAKSKAVGWFHHRGPFNFEYMDALEEAGMIHPEMNYESELQRVANWPDLYMQGVGLRYRALRLLKQGGSTEEALFHLEQSSSVLSGVGADLELARTKIELARLYLRGSEYELSRKLLKEAYKVLSGVNEELFPYELRPYLDGESDHDRIIRVLTDFGNAVGTVRDRKKLLEKIITLLTKLTLAGRGGFFIAGQDSKPELVASRNLDKTMVESSLFRSSHELILNAFNADLDKNRSNNSNDRSDARPGDRMGWALCRPVVLQDQILGVIYLDNTLVDLSPPETELAFLEVILNHVAVALDNAQAYEEIIHLKERLEDENRFYRIEMESSANLMSIMGKSKGIQRVLSQIRQVAPTNTTVLVHGETGVGKELVARAIHNLSSRRDGPFISVNVASLEFGVISSELFGHEKGSFTGAMRTRRGRFELADGGTLFLDDIDNLSLEIQAKILRILQEKEFQRVGGDKTIYSDFRLIAATNQNLEELIRKDQFRSDLYYRLNVFPIHVIPLRDRLDDIPLLAAFFMEKYAAKLGKKILGISKKNVQKLLAYPWPGNVRELEHIIERAVILSEHEHLFVPDLVIGGGHPSSHDQFLPYREMEKIHILESLRRCNWRVSGKGGAAELLDLPPTTLYSKMKKLGISKNLSYE
jgi:transcriptional regulator with GAF, ATPase, and Fis domain